MKKFSKIKKWIFTSVVLVPPTTLFAISCSENTLQKVKSTYNDGLNVLWIGVDGFSANIWKKNKTSNIEKLISKSNWTMDAQDIMPSKTYPNWSALLTSQKPDKTGIDKNPGSILFSKLKKTPTKQNNYGKGVAFSIFDAIKKETQLRTTFAYGLTKQFNLKDIVNKNSVDNMLYATRDKIPPIDPEIKKKLQAKHNDYFEFLKVSVGYELSNVTDEEVIKQTTDLIIENKTDFAFGHLAGLDIRGHEFNWGSQIYINYMKKIDTYIGNAIKKLKESNNLKNTIIVITSDHGGVINFNSHGGNTPDERTVPIIIFNGRKQKEHHLGNISNLDVAPTLAKQLKISKYYEWEGSDLKI